MKLKYTNPHLTIDEIKEDLDKYFKTTKPQRFFDDLEKSQSQYMMNQSFFDKSTMSIGSLETTAVGFQIPHQQGSQLQASPT